MKKLILTICLLFIATSVWSDSEITVGGSTGTAKIWQDEGTSLRPRPYINVSGDTVSAYDDSGKTILRVLSGATNISVDTSNFTTNLTSTDDTVQQALETLDILSTNGGAETNSLETVVTGIADGEVLIGTGADAGVYVAGLAACGANEKIEYTAGTPDTFSCETIAVGDAEVANNITVDLATLATTLTITDNESTAENNALIFSSGGDLDGGNMGLESDGTCYYTPSTGKITATGFVGALTGNASTATALATARAIGGVNFDGTAAITPTTIVVADTTDTTSYVGLWESATGSLLPKTDAGITYNAGTGMLTATGFTGPLTGNADTTTEVGTLTNGDMCTNDGSAVQCTINTEAELETAMDALDIVTVTADDITSANLATLVNGETGTGDPVFHTSPTLVTPVLGAATATTINKVTITAPASASTLTIADGKTLTATNTVNLNTMTDEQICNYEATGTQINCDLAIDASATCGGGSICGGGHTHPTTEISGVNGGTDLTADLEEEGVTCTDCVSKADLADDATEATKCIVIETPVDADDFLFFRNNSAITVTSLDCIVEDATSAVVVIVECDSAGDNCGTSRLSESMTCDVDGATDDGTIGNPGIAAGAWMRAQIGTVTGTPGHVAACFTFTRDD